MKQSEFVPPPRENPALEGFFAAWLAPDGGASQLTKDFMRQAFQGFQAHAYQSRRNRLRDLEDLAIAQFSRLQVLGAWTETAVLAQFVLTDGQIKRWSEHRAVYICSWATAICHLKNPDAGLEFYALEVQRLPRNKWNLYYGRAFGLEMFRSAVWRHFDSGTPAPEFVVEYARWLMRYRDGRARLPSALRSDICTVPTYEEVHAALMQPTL